MRSNNEYIGFINEKNLDNGKSLNLKPNYYKYYVSHINTNWEGDSNVFIEII
jgi:hypothetical protein